MSPVLSKFFLKYAEKFYIGLLLTPTNRKENKIKK